MRRTVAIVGAGIGAQHLDAFLDLPDHFEVAVLCDLDGDRARALAAPHGISAETDLTRVLADPSINIVDVCLPPHLHVSTTSAALEAGKSVICEKPLATSLADADRLADLSRTSEGSVFPVFQYRFGTGMAQLLHLIDQGLAGRCYAGSLETHWDRSSDYYAIDWRGTWAGEQGGALLGHAIHIHDLARAILGPVAQVHALTATRVNPIQVEDCAALAIRMESGALLTSSVTLGASGNTSRLRLMFEGFTVESDHSPYAPCAQPWRFTARDPVKQNVIDRTLDEAPTVLSGYHGLFCAIANTLNGLPSNAVTLEDGRASVEFVTAAYHSARTGAPVDLPLGRDHAFYKGWRTDLA